MPKGIKGFQKGHRDLVPKESRKRASFKIGKALKGRKLSEATKLKMSNSRKGRKHSKETIAKIILSNRKRKVSQETREKMRISHLGSRSFLWKGGICNKNRLIRASLMYKQWRKKVFERDNYTCVWCRKKSGNGKRVLLTADHIKPFSLYPELRFAIDNGRTLCLECHKTTKTWGVNIIKKDIIKDLCQ